MKVKELIEELKQFDPELPVIVYDEGDDHTESFVHTVRGPVMATPANIQVVEITGGESDEVGE